MSSQELNRETNSHAHWVIIRAYTLSRYLIGANGGGKVTKNSDKKLLPKWMNDLTPIETN